MLMRSSLTTLSALIRLPHQREVANAKPGAVSGSGHMRVGRQITAGREQETEPLAVPVAATVDAAGHIGTCVVP